MFIVDEVDGLQCFDEDGLDIEDDIWWDIVSDLIEFQLRRG